MSQPYELLPALGPKPGRYATEDPALVPGDHAKVGFRIAPESRETHNGEWMWVELTAVEGRWPKAVYRGELCNRPFFISPEVLRVGQPIEFKAGHIYDVVRDSESRPAWEREEPPG
jgi:hypothetical protein